MLADTTKSSRKTKRTSLPPRPVQTGNNEAKRPIWWEEMRAKIEAKATNVRTLFRMFDADKSGTVDARFRDGLHYINVELSDREFAELLDMVDADGGGQIDYTEFAKGLLVQTISMPMDGLTTTIKSKTFTSNVGSADIYEVAQVGGAQRYGLGNCICHFRKARSGEMRGF